MVVRDFAPRDSDEDEGAAITAQGFDDHAAEILCVHVSWLTLLEPTRLVQDLVETPQTPSGHSSGLGRQGSSILQGTEDSPLQDVVVAFLRMDLNETVDLANGYAGECAAAGRVGDGLDARNRLDLAGLDDPPVQGGPGHVVSPHLVVDPDCGEEWEH